MHPAPVARFSGRRRLRVVMRVATNALCPALAPLVKSLSDSFRFPFSTPPKASLILRPRRSFSSAVIAPFWPQKYVFILLKSLFTVTSLSEQINGHLSVDANFTMNKSLHFTISRHK